MKIISALFSMLVCLSTSAQTPLADLAVPPPDARHFVIMSSVGKYGESTRWTTSAGVHIARESLNLRGQVSELESSAHFAGDGMIDLLRVRGFTPKGDATEWFQITDGKAKWKSRVDAGSAQYTAPALYIAFDGPMGLTADLVEKVVAAPGKCLNLLPRGQLRAERLTSVTVGDGASKRQVTAYALSGLAMTPIPVWVDETGQFFARVGSLSWMPAGQEAAQPLLQKSQDEALAKRSPGILRSLLKAPSGPVAFTHVRAFVDGNRFVDDATVVIDNGVISGVGPSVGTAVPKSARVIDGKGKTLVPGLWDAHMHFGDDASGPMLLSLGITSARDPGNVNELTLARARRRANGQLLMPRVYPSLLIDGKGPRTDEVASVATSLAEALAIVRKAKSQGFVAIKIYGTFNPQWLPDTIAEAHRLGLHVHGHLPAGVRPLQAIMAGYDELTHINFLMMQAMPDAVVEQSNGMARFEGPARYAKDVSLEADPMRSLIETIARRKITVDPTVVFFENMLVHENGDLPDAYVPFLDMLPPAVERRLRGGGLALPPDLSRADYRRSFARFLELVGALHRAGVPIVAGTDGSGLELVRELELYVAAGFTASEALASATLNPARLVGADARTGSIAAGKDADLVLVEGDPSKTIGDLRHTDMVVMNGKLMDADALRRAGGFIAGQPNSAF